MPTFNLKTVLDNTPDHVNGKHEGPSPTDAPKLFDSILEHKSTAIIAIIESLDEVDDGSDYKSRFLLHGVATYVCGPGKEKQRKMVAGAIASLLDGPQVASVKTYMLQTLQLIGDKDNVNAIANHLHDDKLGDPAAAALVAIGKDGAPELRKALKLAEGRAQLTIVQSLGVLKDTASAKDITAIADSSTGEAKVAALRALANMGDANSVDRLLKAADAAKGIARDKSTQACLILAENLAAVGRITEARRIYQHLKDQRTREDEQFVRDAAERGLKAIAGLKSAS